MSVKNYYIRKPNTVNLEQSVKEVIELFTKEHFNSAIVTNDNGEIVGVISIYDIAEAIIPPGMLKNPTLGNSLYKKGFFEQLCQEVGKRKVKDFMQKDFITVSPDTHILEVLGYFLSKDLNLVPVVENKKIVGIMTRSNIKRAIALGMEILKDE